MKSYDRAALSDWKQYHSVLETPKICCQIYGAYCKRYELDRTSDGGDQGTSEYTIVREEYVNDTAVVAGVAYYPDENGTSTRNPRNIGRDEDLEAAIENLLKTVADLGERASGLNVTLKEAPESQ